MRAHRSLLIWALAGAGLGSHALAQPPAAPAPRHAVVVSIDGLMPETYLQVDELGVKIPHLRRLMQQGAFAHGVVGVLPTVTYPSHTTLITGVPPRIHGIETNTVFDPEDKAGDAWHWFAKEVRVPTLVSAARARGLKTAAVSWPVSVGMGADWLLPEFWRPGSEHVIDAHLLDALSTPGLIDAVATHRGRPFPHPPTDEERADSAVYLLETHKPNLLLLHIFELDSAEHRHGPRSPEAFAALERSDAIVGRLLAAVAKAGIADRTLFAVVSDHGFLPVSQGIQPNTLLRDAGLVKLDAAGKVSEWRAFFHTNGGSAGLVLKDPGDRETLAKVRELLAPKAADPEAGLAEVLDADRIARLGGSAGWALVLDARAGFGFRDSTSGGWLGEASYRGAHGHDPERPELRASLLLIAPGLAKRGDLGIVPMTAVGPTIARYLGLELAPEAGEPLAIW